MAETDGSSSYITIMATSYNVALVGAGGIAAAHRHAATASERRVQVVAAVDTNPDAPAAVDLPRYDTLEALLASEHKPDGLILCTPPSVRGDVIGPALEAGLAVLSEKPIARTYGEAKQLLALVERHDAAERVFVGYCHRFTPAVVEMRRWLSEGKIGTPIRFENTFACWHPTMGQRWMSDIDISGGGSWLDTGCHSLDLFRFATNEKPGGGDVKGAVFYHEWPGRGDSDGTVLLQGSSGMAAVIQSGWQEPERFIVRLVGTKGMLSYDYLVPEVLYWQPSDVSFDVPVQHAIESNDVRFTRQLEAFARRARGASEAGDERLCTVAEAVEVARLVDEATKLAGA